MSEDLRRLRGVVSAWRKLDRQRKQDSLLELRKELEHGDDILAEDSVDEVDAAEIDQDAQSSNTGATVEEPHTKVFEDVHLFSSSSYLYYYPTLHWSMDKTPDTNDYWIGVYEKGAPDDRYLAYHWISQVAKGSYKVGRLRTTAGKVATNRTDVFELRMFNGSRRCLKAKTNQLVGAVLSTAINLYSRRSLQTEEEIDSKAAVEPSTSITEAIDGLTVSDAEENEIGGGGLMEKLTFGFLSKYEKGKVLHLLEQELLSDKITGKDDEIVKRREPNREFSDLGKNQESKSKEPTVMDETATANIVLEISLDYAKVYVYPSLHTSAAVHQNKAWFGVYKAKSNTLEYEYKSGSLMGDKQWLRKGAVGDKELSCLEESSASEPVTSIDGHYLGVIFDKLPGEKEYAQKGFAATSIHATVYVTPSPEDIEFKPNFDVAVVKKCVRLSTLAYFPYTDVQRDIVELKYTAEMQIFDRLSDTDGFIASDSTTAIVAFRGSGTNDIPGLLVIPDMITNLNFASERVIPDDPNSPKAHKGFVKALNSVYDSILAQLKPILGKKKLIFTGHSLGAALASLLAYRLTKQFAHLKSSVTLVTFACPPVGSKEFSEYFSELNSSTITIQGDLVSSGLLVKAGTIVDLHKPATEKFLPMIGGHILTNYIKQIESLSDD